MEDLKDLDKAVLKAVLVKVDLKECHKERQNKVDLREHQVWDKDLRADLRAFLRR